MNFLNLIMENLWITWLIIAGILLFIEIETTALVSLWFVFGAIITAVFAFFCDNIMAQFFVFLVTSLIFLFVCKKFYKKKIKPNEGDDVNYSPVGKVVVACEDINAFGGKVRVDDVYWKAICENGEILEGEKVRVSSLSGTTLVVEKI